jgi:hypothetical protein
VDSNVLCLFWASKEQRQCTSNSQWMTANCAAACGTCSPKQITFTTCADADPTCSTWSSAGECAKNPFYMIWKCAKACSFCTAAGAAAYPAPFAGFTAGVTSAGAAAAGATPVQTSMVGGTSAPVVASAMPSPVSTGGSPAVSPSGYGK